MLGSAGSLQLMMGLDNWHGCQGARTTAHLKRIAGGRPVCGPGHILLDLLPARADSLQAADHMPAR